MKDPLRRRSSVSARCCQRSSVPSVSGGLAGGGASEPARRASRAPAGVDAVLGSLGRTAAKCGDTATWLSQVYGERRRALTHAHAKGGSSAADETAFERHLLRIERDEIALSDQGRASTIEERSAISKLAKFWTDANLEVTPLLRKEPGRGRQLADLFESSNAKSQENAQALYQGKITWGEYNTRRRNASAEFGSSWSSITAK